MGAPETNIGQEAAEVAAQDDLSVIEPIATGLTFNGVAVDVTPLKVGQLPKFARALKGIDTSYLTNLAEGDISALLALTADHGEALVQAVSIATGIPEAEFEGADSDEFVLLALKVIKVNADFFVRRLMPAIKRAMDQADGDGKIASTP